VGPADKDEAPGKVFRYTRTGVMEHLLGWIGPDSPLVKLAGFTP
jgi:hypothetical protein